MKILVVDDETVILECVEEYFTDYPVKTCSDPFSALRELEKEFHDILIVDYKMPGLSGLELLLEAKRKKLYRYGILLSAWADKDILKEMVNSSLVRKVIEKPLRLEALKLVIHEALGECEREACRERELGEMAALLGVENLCKRVIGLGKGLADQYATLAKYAQSDESVLITGETGTGKEVMARLLHGLSPRNTHPFIKINCAAIPDSLLESELFGYMKGAFSGAFNDHKGKIEAAHGGTLFLDEIGELKPELQTKLLHVIQEKRFEPVGSCKPINVDFRLIAATNSDLEEAMRRKAFREDLFFRISALPLRLPPLRERRSDLRDLCAHFLKEYCVETGRREPQVSEEAYSFLESYRWPGNVRELENALKRALILLEPGREQLEAKDFAFLGHVPNEQIGNDPVLSVARAIADGRLSFSELEPMVLRAILAESEGSIRKAVERTGIPKDRFYRLAPRNMPRS